MKANSLHKEAKEVLLQLAQILQGLTKDEYTEKIPLLSNASIGEHTRHIIELFEQLLTGYDFGEINYDNRKRNIKLQTDIDFAIESIAFIITNLCKSEKNLTIISLYNNQETNIVSNYSRELMYNIEHCIHHQAIIKIWLDCLAKFEIHENFGVAKSTITYRNQCVQ